MRINPAFLIFLSFVIGITNVIDTTVQLFFYRFNSPYPLGTLLKPLFFMLQVALLLMFIKLAAPQLKEMQSLRTFIIFHVFLAISAVLVFLATFFGELMMSGQFVDLLWFGLFLLGPTLTSFWLAKTFFQHKLKRLAIIFLVIGLAFSVKPLDGLYFWSQTYYGFALPYPTVILGMFGPLLLMASALFLTLIFVKLRYSNRGLIGVLRDPFFWAGCIAFILPLLLSATNYGLANTIIKAIAYYSLSYTGFDWFAVSIYLASFIGYIYIIVMLRNRLDKSLSSTLIKFGCLSLVWNGVSVIMLGYSSIAGNLLSLDALAIGLYFNANIAKKLATET